MGDKKGVEERQKKRKKKKVHHHPLLGDSVPLVALYKLLFDYIDLFSFP
jgi:hypothetical protein